MGLPIISGGNPNKVLEFYKTLLYNVQSLETLGKVERVNGMTRRVLEKLKGVKADLVRGEEGWQEWDLPRLIVALKRWKDINPIEEIEPQKKLHAPKRFEKSPPDFITPKTMTDANELVCTVKNPTIFKNSSKFATVDERKRLLAEKKIMFQLHRS